MKSKLLVAAAYILFLPMIFSPALGENKQIPFAVMAIAGHVVGSGEACSPCGCGNCRCGQGEEPGGCTNGATPGSGTEKPKKADSTPDPGSAALILILALFAWFKLR